jgi:hypothetical protein
MPESPVERMRRLRDEAVDALEVADFATAHTKLLAAQALYDTTPNSEKDGLRAEFRSIEGLMKRIEAKIRGGALKSLPVEYTRPEMDLDERWDS